MPSPTAPHRPRAMAWDPKIPAALALPTGTSNAFRMDTMLSHTGVGCNDHELRALIKLLDAHQAFLQLPSSRRRNSWASFRSLVKSYRATLRECLQEWEEDLVQQGMMMTTDNDDQQQQRPHYEERDEEHIEALKLVYAVTQLSEIFLLPVPIESSLEYYEDSSLIPGAVTADMVRYLRHHLTSEVLADEDPELVKDLFESLQPDQMEGGGAFYWKAVETMVRRGLLENAWGLLSRHSLFRRAELDNCGLPEYEALQLEQDRQGFLDLRSVLLSAPIPGGRNEDQDGGELEDEDRNKQRENNETLLEGVPRYAYQMWETSRTSAVDGIDYPIAFTPRAASTVRQTWMHYLHEMEPIHRLKRKLPQLEPILRILSGELKQIQFESWGEALLAELIYARPSTRPSDLHIRAARLLRQYPPATPRGMEDVQLSIMKGDAGRVMQAMFTLGGASGAALPATVTSLLCNVFMDAGLFESENLQVELLQAASFAILSSLANFCGSNNPETSSSSDVGIRLVVRLLLPFAKPSADPRIIATLAESLERHTMSSDAETRNLLSMVRPLIERKSVRILDGCVSLVLSRYRHFVSVQRPGGAVHWLLVGLELESLLFVDEENGEVEDWQKVQAVSDCYRHLVTWCGSTARSLLRCVLEEKIGLGQVYRTATSMMASIADGPLTQYATKLSEVRTLSCALAIFDNMAGDPADWQVAAKNIAFCLQEQVDHEDNGIVATIAPRSMHWDLLQLGCRILESEENRQGLERVDRFTPSFDVKGIQVQLEQLTIITASREVEGLKPLPSDQVASMRLALGKGLMRAFVFENARRKLKPSSGEDAKTIEKIRAIDLGRHNIDTQERVVAKMLDI